ncbi:unnamed protein product [Rotaria socialis]
MYGSCEVMGDATYEVFESVDHFHNELLFENRVSIGYPIENTIVYIVDPDERGVAIVTANTGSVTQQLAKYVFEYDENLVVQLNEYRDPSGDLVFSHADPNQTMTISMKYIV